MVNKLYRFLFSKKSIKVLLVLLSLVVVSTYFNRYIETDESWSAEHSYSLLEEGIVRIKTMPEILNLDERTFIYHKFFTWVGSGVISIFGFKILPLKFTSLIWTLLLFVSLYNYHKLSPHKFTKEMFWLSVLLIISSPLIILKSFSFRPDTLLMLESFLVFYFIQRHQRSGQYFNVVIAGLIAGLGFFTHLNGVAFCVAGFIFYLLKKDFKSVLIFSTAAIPVCFLYFIDLLFPIDNFHTFIWQITNWPTVNHGDNYIGGGIGDLILRRIEKLLSEHQRFFWGESVIGFSVIFFVAVFSKLKFILRNYRDEFIFLIVLIISLNVFGSHVAERYLPFYYGLMSILASAVIIDLKKNSLKVLKIIVILLFVLQAIFIVINLRETYSRNYNTVESHANILSKVPSEARILIPWELVFNEFESYDLYSFKTYEYLGEDLEGGRMTQKQLFAKAVELGMDYIIINQRMASYKGNWFYNWEIQPQPYYKEYFKNDRYVILKMDSTNLK